MDGLAVVLATALEGILRARYDDFQLLELDTQGECSYTALLITTNGPVQNKKIIQARENCFVLDLDITDEASRVYGHLAPATSLLATKSLNVNGAQQTFHFYELDLVPGVPYKSLLPKRKSIEEDTIVQQRMLVGHLARFFARGWRKGQLTKDYQNGKVGAKIQVKVEQLSKELPTAELRTVAQWALTVLPLLDTLPVVLTHGDIVPSNIMVHPDSGMLRGMVDWVEAEFLPFGLAFYGLEYLLGFPSKRRDSMTDSATQFLYYDSAPEMRLYFWNTLFRKVPEIQRDPQMLKAIHVAKIVGTLLWFGFAWDGGKIDRVVTPERDSEVIAYLEAFLFAEIDHWDELGRNEAARYVWLMIKDLIIELIERRASLSPVSSQVSMDKMIPAVTPSA